MLDANYPLVHYSFPYQSFHQTLTRYNYQAGFQIKIKLICRFKKRSRSKIYLDIHSTKIPSYVHKSTLKDFPYLQYFFYPTFKIVILELQKILLFILLHKTCVIWIGVSVSKYLWPYFMIKFYLYTLFSWAMVRFCNLSFKVLREQWARSNSSCIFLLLFVIFYHPCIRMVSFKTLSKL